MGVGVGVDVDAGGCGEGAGVLDCKWERLRGASGSNHRHCESQASSDAMNTIYESIITTTMLSFFFLLFLL